MFADIAHAWQENWRRREIEKDCNSIVCSFINMYATATYAVAFLSLAVIRTYRAIYEFRTDGRPRTMKRYHGRKKEDRTYNNSHQFWKRLTEVSTKHFG